MAYALGCVASEPGLGLAPDRRRLRARVSVGLRFLVRLGELAEHLVALVVQPLQAARLALGKRVGGENREADRVRSEEHTSELQSRLHLVCRLLLEKKKNKEQQ